MEWPISNMCRPLMSVTFDMSNVYTLNMLWTTGIYVNKTFDLILDCISNAAPYHEPHQFEVHVLYFRLQNLIKLCIYTLCKNQSHNCVMFISWWSHITFSLKLIWSFSTCMKSLKKENIPYNENVFTFNERYYGY